jgi:branched-chain amino acid transport system permease protein
MTTMPVASSIYRRLSDFGARHAVVFGCLALASTLLWAPYEALAVNILIFGLFALGFNLLLGYTGLLSFGQAAFFGLGAYGCGIGIVHAQMPPLLAILVGTLVAVVGAAVIGIMAIRTRGIYFAMVTLALGQCVYMLVFQADAWTGGENGLRGIGVSNVNFGLFQVNLVNPVEKFLFVLFFVALGFAAVERILASPFGMTLEAIRENESRVVASGYDVKATKWLAFVLAGTVCGLAGALYALHLAIVPVDIVSYTNSGLVVILALLGGINTLFGPFIGAAVFLVLEDVVSHFTVHGQFIVGILIVVLVLFFPRGIWGSVVTKLDRK